jgi:hypothetical protein
MSWHVRPVLITQLVSVLGGGLILHVGTDSCTWVSCTSSAQVSHWVSSSLVHPEMVMCSGVQLPS